MTDAKAIPGFEERFAETKACRLRYFVGGQADGDPVVLVHGLGGCAANWVDMAPLLAESRRVLVPELPGHGLSTPLPAVPNLGVFADRIALVAEREQALPAAFVGHSLGAVVALRLALRRPGDVSALVLAAAAGISSTSRRARYGLRILGIIGPRRLVAPWADSVAGSPFLRYAVFELGELRCPTLILWGARDNQLPLVDGFEFARRLDAPLRVIADCGHLLIGERPGVCAEAIENFLAEASLATPT